MSPDRYLHGITLVKSGGGEGETKKHTHNNKSRLGRKRNFEFVFMLFYLYLYSVSWRGRGHSKCMVIVSVVNWWWWWWHRPTLHYVYSQLCSIRTSFRMEQRWSSTDVWSRFFINKKEGKNTPQIQRQFHVNSPLLQSLPERKGSSTTFSLT